MTRDPSYPAGYFEEVAKPLSGPESWWNWDTEDDNSWNSEFGGEDIRALVRERNRLIRLLAEYISRSMPLHLQTCAATKDDGDEAPCDCGTAHLIEEVIGPKWDGSGSIYEPCAVVNCPWFGDYHRFSLHRATPDSPPTADKP